MFRTLSHHQYAITPHNFIPHQILIYCQLNTILDHTDKSTIQNMVQKITADGFDGIEDFIECGISNWSRPLHNMLIKLVNMKLNNKNKSIV